MGQIADTPSATREAFDLVADLTVDPTRWEDYPDGTVFVPMDAPGFDEIVRRALAQGRPVAIVDAGGNAVLLGEAAGLLASTVLRVLGTLLRFGPMQRSLGAGAGLPRGVQVRAIRRRDAGPRRAA